MARQLKSKKTPKTSSKKKSTKPSRLGIFGRARRFVTGKSYHLPLPDNKAGKVLGKKVPIAPGFLVNAFKELRLTTWPGRKETARLTLAVFIFALMFGIFVASVDFVLYKIFKEI